jgi:hypothetical protein
MTEQARRELGLQLGSAGGVGALIQRSAHSARTGTVSHKTIRAVPECSIVALFGQPRTALIRLSADVSEEGLKSYKIRRSALDICARNGTAVPDDVSRDLVFFHFQQDHASILRMTPLPTALVEQWMHGFGRWAVRDRGDRTLSSDFSYITGEASRILGELDVLDRALRAGQTAHLRTGTRRAAADLFSKFSTFRTDHVRDLVTSSLKFALLRPFYEDFRTILAAYEQLHIAVPRFVDGVQRQIDTESAAFSTLDSEQEEFTARHLGGIYRAFIRGILGSALKMPESPSTKQHSPANTTQSNTSLAATFNFSPQSTTVSQVPGYTAGFVPAPGGLATVQNAMDVYPSSGPFSLENQARQVAHGYRGWGPYHGPNPGGGSDGIDLAPEFRRLLFAHQIMAGHRSPERLFSQLPPENLPPLAPLDAVLALRTTSFAQGYNPAPANTFSHQQPPPAYQPGLSAPPTGFGGTRTRTKPPADSPPGMSDDLYIPYSYGMLGSYSPYRNQRPPEACFECGLRQAHFGNECPQRFVRIRGEAPPGWRKSGRTVDKDPAQWNGADLTDAARAEYRAFISTHHLAPHRVFPVSIEDIVSTVPPLARKGVMGVRP